MTTWQKKRYSNKKKELTEEQKQELARFVEKIQNLIPSEQQDAIFERARSGKGHYVISAGPGSGKTTTAIKASTWFKGSAISFSFNKKIQIDSNRKLKALGSKMTASTLHSFGLLCIAKFIEGQGGQVRVKEEKYEAILDEYIQKTWDLFLQSIREYLDTQEEDENPVNVSELLLDASSWSKTLVHYCQVSLTTPTPDNLVDLVDQFDLNDINVNSVVWSYVCAAVQHALEEGKRKFEQSYEINLDDMIYYPNVYKQIPVQVYDHIILDEAQDASRAAQGLLKRACHKTTQVFAIGDPKQSIYAFAGADHNSIPNLIEMLQAEVLPLRVCYRCGRKIIDLANQLCSEDEKIIPAPGAHEGNVDVITRSVYLEMLQPGDACIGRTTARLVEDCLKVLQSGKLATVLGKKIGESILAIVKRVEEMRVKVEGKRRKVAALAHDLSNFIELAEEYQRKQEQVIRDTRKKNPEYAISELQDKIDTVKAFHTAYITKCVDEASRRETDPRCFFDRSIEDFKAYIMGLFTEEENNNKIQFMTAHRSKGLEFKRVFVVGTDQFPHPKAKGERQKKQEENLMYVTITRAMDELYFVGAPFDAIQLPEEEETVEAAEAIIASHPETAIVNETPVKELAEDETFIEEAIFTATPVVDEIEEKGFTKDGKRRVRAAGAGRKAKKAEEKRQKKQYVMNPQMIADIEKGEEITFEGCKTQSQLLEKIIQASPVYQALIAQLRGPQPPDGGYEVVEPEEEPAPGKSEVTEPIEEPIAETTIVDVTPIKEELQALVSAQAAPIELKYTRKEAIALILKIGKQQNYRALWYSSGSGGARRVLASNEEEWKDYWENTDDEDIQAALSSWEPKYLQAEPATDIVTPLPLFDDEHQGAGRTVRMMFVCKTKYPKPCRNRWAIDYYEKDHRLYRDDHGQIVSFEDDCKRGCPVCKKPYFSAKTLKARFNHSVKCTSSCKNATSDECECVCGGLHHGENKLISVALYQPKAPQGDHPEA